MSKMKKGIPLEEQIDLLIGTDCISEGQNLQCYMGMDKPERWLSSLESYAKERVIMFHIPEHYKIDVRLTRIRL